MIRPILVSKITLECEGCPTIYNFEDVNREKYYFRLRHGYARIHNETTKETILEDDMNGFDGCCSWDDVIKWALKYDVVLINVKE
jgi:hypothetical protein